jgi:hypothetical protein
MEDQQLPPASNQLENFFNIVFDASTRAQVRQAAVWAKVCALSAFIGYGIALIVAIFGHYGYTTESESGLRIEGVVRTTSIMTVLVSALFGGFINYFLYRFAASTVKGMDSLDTVKTNAGFDSLRIYFKIYGIILIVAFSLIGLVFLGGIIVGLSRL